MNVECIVYKKTFKGKKYSVNKCIQSCADFGCTNQDRVEQFSNGIHLHKNEVIKQI